MPKREATAAEITANDCAADEKSKDTRVYFDGRKLLRDDRFYWYGRRAQDILLSLIALLVLWPVMLLIALIVWIDSPGASPIFMQTRIGRNGVPFQFLKFRTMIPDAEQQLNELLHRNEMDGPVFKIKDDPRITRVGRFLRKSSLDELPQLINILQGDMSIVGPRPALPREVEQYDAYALQRLYVSPGLTCYWQIQTHRNELTFDEWMDLDMKYIQERSFVTDWKIIFKTIGAVCKMSGA
ncbi:MAG: sugar transferase [Clostridia bacterium]|nr:sugar transferase [Clostridia bacterium]